MRLFAIFFSLDHKFSLKLNMMIACDDVQHLTEVKFTIKKWGDQIWVKWAKIRPQIRFFAILSSFSSLVFLNVAEEARLGEFLEHLLELKPPK